jgi:hypothetical protein
VCDGQEEVEGKDDGENEKIVACWKMTSRYSTDPAGEFVGE